MEKSVKTKYVRVAAVAAAVVVSLVISGCSPSSESSPRDESAPTELIYGLQQSPVGGFDPGNWAYTTYAPIEQAAYETLLHANTDGGFDPALATEWGWESPELFTLSLREGVTFTDGEVFDAEAVKANLEHYKVAQGRSAAQLQPIESVEVVDEHEVAIHLAEPQPDMPLILSQNMGMMISPAVIASPDQLLTAPVGAGPYILDAARTVTDDTYTFTKNPDYWNADAIGFDTMVFKIFSDGQAAFNALQSGQVDLTFGTSENLDAATAAGLSVDEAPGTLVNIQIVDMAGDEVPALGDVRVRQALNYAIDRDAIVETLQPGRATPQVWHSAGEAYDASLDDYYPYDPDEAKRLLKEAGYEDGFTFKMNNHPLMQTVAQAVAGYLAEVGVTLEIVVQPTVAEFVADGIAGTYPTILAPNVSQSASIDIQNLLLPDGGKNSRGSEDPEITSIYDEAASMSPEDRASEYHKIAQIVLDDAWFVGIAQATSYTFYNGDEVDGLQTPVGHIIPMIYGLEPVD